MGRALFDYREQGQHTPEGGSTYTAVWPKRTFFWVLALLSPKKPSAPHPLRPANLPKVTFCQSIGLKLDKNDKK